MTATPADTLNAARQGDKDALEQLLVECRPRVHRYALRTCHGSSAEDAVQETLLLVCRYLPSLRSVLAFDGWLAKVVRRECLRLARRFSFLPIPPGSEDELPANLSARPDTDLRLDIARAIQSLPLIYRDVIVLRDFEELMLHEIADRLHLPTETVKTRLYRGRALLRDYLLSE